MCTLCSRRGALLGAASLFALSPTISIAATLDSRVACGFINNDDLQRILATMTPMPSSDVNFHAALIAELRHILQILPVNPGFQYVDAENALALRDTYVAGTKGTVLIGQKLVKQLLQPNDGGVSVAGVLAHECGHIYQYFGFTDHYDLLSATTPVLFELHADALAGYYLGKKIGSTSTRLSVMEMELIRFSTDKNLETSSHGTSAQRNAALDKGYRLAQSGMPFEPAAIESGKYVRGLM